MRGPRIALIALGLVLTTACATYGERAVPITQAQVATAAGWIVAAPTPTVLQRNRTDCGAAVLAMVAARWHVTLSLDDAARALPPPLETGVRLGDLRDVARRHGLAAFAIIGDREVLAHELSAGRPVIVGLLRQVGARRALSHFELVVALREPTPGRSTSELEIVTIDPGRGWQVRTWTDLEAEWKPAGHPALVVIGAGAASR